MSHDVDITAHHLRAGVYPSPSPASLLDRARELVDAATGASRWRSIKPLIPPKLAASNYNSRAACYVWARTPPAVLTEAVATRHMPALEEWDAPLEEEIDTLDLSSLAEFESTSFHVVLRPQSRVGKRKSPSPSPIDEFADDADVNSLASRSNKHLRSSTPLAHISISKLIPFPHYYESPDPALPPPPDIEHIPPFRIVRGISTMLPYARTSWLVPLRGRPPFDGASSADLISSTISKPQPLPPERQVPMCIHWTPPAISQFWTFLLRQRSMNNFGPIAFSYSFGSYSFDTCRGNWRDRLWDDAQEPEREDAGGEWEYIKIYHDGQYALKLRSLLDSFRWCDEKHLLDGSRRNRVLKGARLVLMDERGDVMLLA